jgi:hypothetical protein
LGLSAPRGLWNLSDLTDASGNARNLTNKGGVSFAPGINAVNASAAQFAGSAAQALYIADTGAADSFRISTGSWGAWFRTAKRGTSQGLLTKRLSATQIAYQVAVGNTNTAAVGFSGDGTSFAGLLGVSDVCDDRWHFAVATQDGTYLRIYVDGVLEAATTPGGGGSIFGSSAPLNIGAYGADSGAAAADPNFGRVDEAFVSADVLTEDQVRLLYAARIAHTLGAQPKSVNLSVRRQRRGAALATTDFSTGPLRLHNFTAGSLADQGSNNTALAVAAGTPVSLAGADGALGGGYSFPGSASLAATDAGLPSGLNARSYGCWFKTTTLVAAGIIGWGTVSTADARLWIFSDGRLYSSSGGDQSASGPYMADGQWHYVVVAEDNTAADGVKRKLYVDGRLSVGSTTLNSLTLAGANRFRISAMPDGTSPFTGQIDGAFVTGYAIPTDEVQRLYNKAAQTMAASPKNAGDHVEGYDSGSVLIVADTLDAQHLIDLTLA